MLFRFKFLLLMAVALVMYSPVSQAVPLQTLTTKDGISVWLVESHSLPMVSVQVAFRAGSAFDPQDKEGLAALTASLMNEGAGPLKSAEFMEKLQSVGASIGANADKLNLTVNAQTLSQHKKEVFKLLGLALTKPRFDKEAFKRMQAETLSALKRSQQSSAYIAQLNFSKALYGEHPYAHPTSGFTETVKKLTKEDVGDFHSQFFTKKNMVISIVGDMTADEAVSYVEKYISPLKEGTVRKMVRISPSQPDPLIQKIEMNVPQSTIMIGHLGIDRHHKDYFAAYVMNYILGGGGFNSRLMEEVREKRGLAYGVSSYFDVLPHKGAFIVSTSTKNKDAQKSIEVIVSELKKIAKNGVSEKEYNGAMNYLKGSFPLRLDSNNKILSYLSVMQMEGLGAHYLDQWVEKISAVTRADIQRVAQELITPERLTTVIVGGVQ